MNKTQYDDWLVKLLDIVNKLIIKVSDLKILQVKIKSSEEINNRIVGYAKRIKSAETTPKGHGYKFTYIKFVLTDECERILMENASKLDVYFYDHSYLDLSDRVFYIKGKSAAQRFMLKDDETNYRDTHRINEYIKSEEAFDDMFYVYEVSSEEYKNAPDNKKLKIIKNEVQ